MLSSYEVVLLSVLLLLMAMALFQWLARIVPPPGTWMAELYRAEPRLETANALFLALLGLSAFIRLVVHFGYLNSSINDLAAIAVGIPLLVLALTVVFLFARGILRTIRAGKRAS